MSYNDSDGTITLKVRADLSAFRPAAEQGAQALKDKMTAALYEVSQSASKALAGARIVAHQPITANEGTVHVADATWTGRVPTPLTPDELGAWRQKMLIAQRRASNELSRATQAGVRGGHLPHTIGALNDLANVKTPDVAEMKRAIEAANRAVALTREERRRVEVKAKASKLGAAASRRETQERISRLQAERVAVTAGSSGVDVGPLYDAIQGAPLDAVREEVARARLGKAKLSATKKQRASAYQQQRARNMAERAIVDLDARGIDVSAIERALAGGDPDEIKAAVDAARVTKAYDTRQRREETASARAAEAERRRAERAAAAARREKERDVQRAWRDAAQLKSAQLTGKRAAVTLGAAGVDVEDILQAVDAGDPTHIRHAVQHGQLGAAELNVIRQAQSAEIGTPELLERLAAERADPRFAHALQGAATPKDIAIAKRRARQELSRLTAWNKGTIGARADRARAEELVGGLRRLQSSAADEGWNLDQFTAAGFITQLESLTKDDAHPLSEIDKQNRAELLRNANAFMRQALVDQRESRSKEKAAEMRRSSAVGAVARYALSGGMSALSDVGVGFISGGVHGLTEGVARAGGGAMNALARYGITRGGAGGFALGAVGALASAGFKGLGALLARGNQLWTQGASRFESIQHASRFAFYMPGQITHVGGRRGWLDKDGNFVGHVNPFNVPEAAHRLGTERVPQNAYDRWFSRIMGIPRALSNQFTEAESVAYMNSYLGSARFNVTNPARVVNDVIRGARSGATAGGTELGRYLVQRGLLDDPLRGMAVGRMAGWTGGASAAANRALLQLGERSLAELGGQFDLRGAMGTAQGLVAGGQSVSAALHAMRLQYQSAAQARHAFTGVTDNLSTQMRMIIAAEGGGSMVDIARRASGIAPAVVARRVRGLGSTVHGLWALGQGLDTEQMTRYDEQSMGAAGSIAPVAPEAGWIRATYERSKTMTYAPTAAAAMRMAEVARALNDAAAAVSAFADSLVADAGDRMGR